MIVKVTKGDNFAFIDNEGEVLHEVKISGNNKQMVNSLDNIINVQVGIRFQGELNGIPPELVVREGASPSKINKASNHYISNYLVRDLRLQGFEVEVIKE